MSAHRGILYMITNEKWVWTNKNSDILDQSDCNLNI